jgi:hypothetical protein
MDAAAMNDVVAHELLVSIAGAACWFAAGALLGLVHFQSLRWIVSGMVAGRAVRSVALQGLRLVVTGAALTLITRWFGAMPLLAGVLGLLAARRVLLEWQR